MRALVVLCSTLHACGGFAPQPRTPPAVGSERAPSASPAEPSTERVMTRSMEPSSAAPAAPSPAPSAELGSVQFTGTITDLSFECWSDRGPCAIKVNETWILTGSRRDPRMSSPPGLEEDAACGALVGIELSGASADELRRRYVGKRAEVHAGRADDHRLTLCGSADFHVRLVQ
jgi:hypothetical protein